MDQPLVLQEGWHGYGCFFSKYPEVAANETRSLIVFNRKDIPHGEYGFLEYYCDDLNCDCHRVLIRVAPAQEPEKILATINYGWQSKEFYEQRSLDNNSGTLKGPFLDPLNPQSKYAPILLELFKHIIKDHKYVDRLQRHYEMFKNINSAHKRVLKIVDFRKTKNIVKWNKSWEE